MQQSAVHCRRL